MSLLLLASSVHANVPPPLDLVVQKADGSYINDPGEVANHHAAPWGNVGPFRSPTGPKGPSSLSPSPLGPTVGFPLLVLENGPPPHSVICRRGVGGERVVGGGSQTQILTTTPSRL